MKTFTSEGDPARPGPGEAGAAANFGSDRAVKLWRVDLDCPHAPRDLCWDVLSAAEAKRARAFHFSVHSRRFVTCRAALRLILGRELKVDPEALALRIQPSGRPCLHGELGGALDFNVSHCGDLALVAIVRSGRVGVDVERVRECGRDMDGIARYFHKTESLALSRLAGRDKAKAFFRMWVCKEAVLKAMGDGLSFGLDRVRVSSLDEEPGVAVEGGAGGRAWRLRLLRFGDCVAAVAVQDGPLPLVERRFDWRTVEKRAGDVSGSKAGRSGRGGFASVRSNI